jgi:hypothetical protein
MQIGEKCIQCLLVNMMFEKKLIHKYEKTPFYSSSLGNELTNFDLELSNLWQLEEFKVVLLELIPMSHCHWNFKTNINNENTTCMGHLDGPL